jgi:hypothetical protein
MVNAIKGLAPALAQDADAIDDDVHAFDRPLPRLGRQVLLETRRTDAKAESRSPQRARPDFDAVPLGGERRRHASSEKPSTAEHERTQLSLLHQFQS